MFAENKYHLKSSENQKNNSWDLKVHIRNFLGLPNITDKDFFLKEERWADVIEGNRNNPNRLLWMFVYVIPQDCIIAMTNCCDIISQNCVMLCNRNNESPFSFSSMNPHQKKRFVLNHTLTLNVIDPCFIKGFITSSTVDGGFWTIAKIMKIQISVSTFTINSTSNIYPPNGIKPEIFQHINIQKLNATLKLFWNV